MTTELIESQTLMAAELFTIPKQIVFAVVFRADNSFLALIALFRFDLSLPPKDVSCDVLNFVMVFLF